MTRASQGRAQEPRAEPAVPRSRLAVDTRTLLPWVVLCVSLAGTLGSFALLRSAAHRRDEAYFQNRVDGATDRIIDRFEMYKSTLRSTAALFLTSDTVTATEFSRFVGRHNIQALYPGIQGVGWSRRLARRENAAVDEQHRIEFLEPLDARNRAAIAYDMYSEPVRRAAMRLARDRGGAALSGKVRLIQEIDSQVQPGFLLYLPVYAGANVPATVPERRERLTGFAYAPFRAHDFFGTVLREEAESALAIAVFDGVDTTAQALLYRSGSTHGARFRRTDTLYLSGNSWTVNFASTPAFEAAVSDASTQGLVLGLGLVASFFLFFLARRLALALHAAEAGNRTKSTFLATMSHELRTPLNGIIGYADLMDAGVPEPVGAAARAHAQRIKHSAAHLLDIVESVLLLARTEASVEQLRVEDVDLPRLIESAIHLTSPLARKKGLELATQLEHPLPQVTTDAAKVRQILVNLIGNAIKFADAGEVRVETRCAPGEVLVRVSDAGPGIPPEHHDLIFTPFWQVDQSATRKVGGSGLGLAVSRNLARLLGGDITVASAPGKGSTFTLRLPSAA